MPKNQVSDLITDTEMAFARLLLAGTMSDRDAAQAVGLNPDTAAYTKSKPRVRAYMIEHHAAVQQHLRDQETERQRRQNLLREQVLDRLWQIANMSPESTRSSISGQVKALSMIVAMEGLIPDRRAAASSSQRAPEKTSTPAPDHPAAGLCNQQEKAIHPEPSPAQEEDKPAPDAVADAPTKSDSANSSEPAPYAPPDTRLPFSMKNNTFRRLR